MSGGKDHHLDYKCVFLQASDLKGHAHSKNEIFYFLAPAQRY